MITKCCPRVNWFIATWASATHWSGLAGRRGSGYLLYRRAAPLTKLFTGNVVTARCAGCHGSRFSLYLCTFIRFFHIAPLWMPPSFMRGRKQRSSQASILRRVSPCGGRREVLSRLHCQRWLAPFPAQSNGGLVEVIERFDVDSTG